MGAGNHQAGTLLPVLGIHHINPNLLAVSKLLSGDLLAFGAELVVDHPLLRLPDALADDVLCGLGGDASKPLGLQGDLHQLPHLGTGLVLHGVLDGDLEGGVLNLLHHLLLHRHIEPLRLRVNLHNVLLAASGILFHRQLNGFCNLLHQILQRDALFLPHKGQGFKKFLNVLLLGIGGVLSCLCLSHFLLFSFFFSAEVFHIVGDAVLCKTRQGAHNIPHPVHRADQAHCKLLPHAGVVMPGLG